MVDYLKMARDWEKARKNKVDDSEMLHHFSQATNELDQTYSPGAFRWLEENRPDMDRKITEAEQNLNDTWLQAREARATLEDFKRDLGAYVGAIRTGLKEYRRYEDDDG